jgi:hypothetical protein
MTDSAGTADVNGTANVDVNVVPVEAAVMPQAKTVSDQQRFLGMVAYGIIGLAVYFFVRVAVLAVFALPFAVLKKTPAAAATWMLLMEPIGLAIGAYLTMFVNRRNRPFHTATAVVVFASVILFHISWPVGNPFVARAAPGLSGTAFVFQAVFVLVGALIGFWRTKPKDFKLPKMLLPPKARAAEKA